MVRRAIVNRGIDKDADAASDWHSSQKVESPERVQGRIFVRLNQRPGLEQEQA